jgi:Rad3-related DNA helicase
MDFDNLIIDLVRKAEPDLDSRLESQAEALSELQCTNPVLGRWIDEYDVDYLMAAFSLDNDEFASNFPAMGHLNQHDRSQILEAFENHFDLCPHCYLKRGYDAEMNARIERAYQMNNSEVAEHLHSSRPLTTPENEAVVCDKANADTDRMQAAAVTRTRK